MFRTGNQGLGISIVGGKVDSSHSSDASALTGIFIKNVLEGPLAAELDCLNTGDRILTVGDVDLRTASHDMAIEAIRQARNPLKLTVQSLRQYTIESDHVSQETPFKNKDKEPEQHNLTVTGDLDRTLGGEEVVLPAALHLSPQRDFSSCKVTPPDGFKSLFPDPTLKTPPTPSPRSSRSLDLSLTDFPKAESIESDMTTDSDDIELQGQETLPNGFVIDRASATFLFNDKNDPEVEDENRSKT